MQRVVAEWLGNGHSVGQLSEKAKEIRRRINRRKDELMPSHPTPQKAAKYRLSLRNYPMEDCIVYKPKNGRVSIFVDDEESLSECVKYLAKCRDLAIDCEGDNEFSYLYLTSIMQISTWDRNFVIDTVKLYEHIHKHFAPIFLNVNIKKVFFGTQDIWHLQKDFGLFFNAVLDVQDIYLQSRELKTLPSLKMVIKSFLGSEGQMDEELEKHYQMFPWRLRPLPKGALEYAQKDSEILYSIWSQVKLTQVNFLRTRFCEYDYSKTNSRVIKKYTFPKISHQKLFNTCKTSRYHRIPELSHPNQEFVAQDMFFTVAKWAELRASTIDQPRRKVLDNKELIDLSLERPLTKSELIDVVPKTAFWESGVITSLLNAISNSNMPDIRCTVENEMCHENTEICVYEGKDSMNDSGYVVLQDDEPMELEIEYATEKGKNQVTVDNNLGTIEDYILKPVEIVEKPSENILELHAPDDDLFDSCSQQYDFTNDNDKYENIAIVDSSKGQESKYDYMNDMQLDQLSNDEIVQNFDVMRRAKLHNYQINQLRRRKTRYLYGVSKIQGIQKRKNKKRKF